MILFIILISRPRSPFPIYPQPPPKKRRHYDDPLLSVCCLAGCGTGCLTMALRDDLGECVTGVDTSRAMLEKFDRKAEGRGVTTVAIEVSQA